MGLTFHATEVAERFQFRVTYGSAAIVLKALGYEDKAVELDLDGSGALDPEDLLPRIVQVRAAFAKEQGAEYFLGLLADLEALALAAQAVGQSISLG
jgi:hypothetical protein